MSRSKATARLGRSRGTREYGVEESPDKALAAPRASRLWAATDGPIWESVPAHPHAPVSRNSTTALNCSSSVSSIATPMLHVSHTRGDRNRVPVYTDRSGFWRSVLLASQSFADLGMDTFNQLFTTMKSTLSASITPQRNDVSTQVHGRLSAVPTALRIPLRFHGSSCSRAIFVSTSCNFVPPLTAFRVPSRHIRIWFKNRISQ
ncbi:hypothetical protein L227DRAFT_573888 [Lentinus tigrinus ALCF2SS1-6]|uniref:Uncharacterized protein n=1 Tax=Lentinus tigrinus ALCF2SS1-6 TaxID=1328759 RepID=A0A5C2SFS1_9APHY|nr:hypothetical protein L227DRAFT_573888 [Lentinus tigrinus ALCF2SS1-6]